MMRVYQDPNHPHRIRVELIDHRDDTTDDPVLVELDLDTDIGDEVDHIPADFTELVQAPRETTT